MIGAAGGTRSREPAGIWKSAVSAVAGVADESPVSAAETIDESPLSEDESPVSAAEASGRETYELGGTWSSVSAGDNEGPSNTKRHVKRHSITHTCIDASFASMSAR